MATAVMMPRQGQSVESCILTEWYKEPGEKVEKGDLLFAYETDKAAFEEEAPVEGILLARFFEEGDEVPVLQNVAVIGKKGESVAEFEPGGRSAGQPEGGASEPAGPPEGGASEPTGDRDTGDTPGPAGQPKRGAGESTLDADTGDAADRTSPRSAPAGGQRETGRRAISPRARRLAEEKRVVLDQVAGSGPGGRIIERDVVEAVRNGRVLTPLARKKLDAGGLEVPGTRARSGGRITASELVEAGAAQAVPEEGVEAGEFTDVPLSNLRKIVAEGMYRSLQNSAQLTHHLSANASGMLRVRKEVKRRMQEGYPHDITLNDLVCWAVIRTLQRHPGANAHFTGDAVRQFRHVNLGFAVDTDRGLMVPTLSRAEELTLQGLSGRLKELASRSKQGRISPDLLAPSSASFTVSNLGNYGVEMFTPVINLPQVAILGVNTIVQRPAVLEDGNFGFQPFIGLSLTYDHRALDGGPATRFLADIKQEIENISTEITD